MYTEKEITIIEPETVNIAVFQKAEIYTAKQELRRPLDLLETTQDPDSSWPVRNDVSISESLGVNPCTLPLLIWDGRSNAYRERVASACS